METPGSDSPIRFGVLRGRLSMASRSPVGSEGGVILSEISDGAAPVGAKTSLSIKYVGRGTENYRYGGRSYAVREGQFLLVPEGLAGQVEVRRGGGDTLGLCINLPAIPDKNPPLVPEAPMLFGAESSALGRTLERGLKRLHEPSLDHEGLAERLFRSIVANTDDCLEDAAATLGRMTSVKASTRHEMLSRLNKARAYLHDIVDRPVDLGELAAAAGMSRFHLLRNFRDCFGAPPAAYHRRVRLERAHDEIRNGRMSCADAAVCFGFSSSGSFSRAYKSNFGHPPTWAA